MGIKRASLLPGPEYKQKDPWDQRPDETVWDWFLFWNYLNQDIPRSLERLADMKQINFMGKIRRVPNIRIIKDLSRFKDWGKRCIAWEQHWLQQGIEKVKAQRNEEQEKAARNHADAGRLLQEAGALPLQARVKKLRKLNADHAKALQAGNYTKADELLRQMADEADISDAGRLVKDGVQIERLGLGMPTTNAAVDRKVSGVIEHEHHGQVEVSVHIKAEVIVTVLKTLTDDELTMLDNITSRMIEQAKAQV